MPIKVLNLIENYSKIIILLTKLEYNCTDIQAHINARTARVKVLNLTKDYCQIIMKLAKLEYNCTDIHAHIQARINK